MDLGLRERGAAVLASTDGLGLAAAKALLAEGARVAISGRDPGRLARALAELEREHGERVLGARLDVTDGPALARHLDEARERFGALHVLVTNAGGPRAGNAAQLADEALDSAFELLPWMRAQGYGRIVAMTSSSVRQPIPGLALSNTLRAGLTAWLKTLSREVAADGVLVNSICTGMFETERLGELIRLRADASGRSQSDERAALVAEIPVGRLGRPGEFGDLVAFLCSERASFLSGIALPCDGGASRSLL
jgi:3-oxoacyl-[acyl-carrier protein] reductase